MRFIRSAVVVAAAAVVPLIPTAAHADANRHTDALGDVQSVPSDAQGSVPGLSATATPEPATTLGDITTVRAANGARKVKVVLSFVDLNPTGLFQVHEIFISTNKAGRVALVTARPGKWGGKSALFTPKFKKVRCSVRHRVDYTHNKVVVKVPRSCLGNPKVIQVGAVTLVADQSKIFYDDGYQTAGAWADPFALSPKIHR